MQDDHNKVLNTLHREGKLPAPSDSQPAVLIQVGTTAGFNANAIAMGRHRASLQALAGNRMAAVCCRRPKREEDSIPEYG